MLNLMPDFFLHICNIPGSKNLTFAALSYKVNMFNYDFHESLFYFIGLILNSSITVLLTSWQTRSFPKMLTQSVVAPDIKVNLVS